MYNFVIVSNRLPVAVSKKDGKLEFSVSSGGLSTAMSSLAIPNQIWVGWPGIAADELTDDDRNEIAHELAKYGCVPVHLTSKQVELFYEGYANDTLWPLFHYFPTYAKYREEYWSAYQEVNWLFAEAAAEQATDTADIWLQDYHLLLAPSMLRTKCPDAKIGLFLHIPFPSYEIFRSLPESTAILEGMLGADLLGFHIYDYARHFVSSCTHILGTSSEQGIIEHEGHRTKVDAFPIGIDYQKFRDTLASDTCKKEIDRLDERYGSQKLILSMDRLDYSKGIVKRLEAYERFLTDYPEFHAKVTMLMIAVPSRTEVETYQQLRDTVEQTVGRINGTFGTVDWAPISYQFQNRPFTEIVSLMAKADVALVTPLRDGMNLVAKEYVASKFRRGGVLILSETTGAVEELIGALTVNPNDVSSLSRKIYRALTMSKKEQRERLAVMQSRISSYTVTKWGSDFITELSTAGAIQRGSKQKIITNTRLEQLVDEYTRADSRLLLLDYDGTLHHFSTSIDADAVKPDAKLSRALKKIADTPNTTLCVVSGRPKAALDAWFKPIKNINLIAEHGAWIKSEGKWRQNATLFDQTNIVEIMENYAARTPGALVEQKDFAVVWHYRRVSPELAYVRNFALTRELEKAVEGSDLVVHEGNKIIEVKPRAVHKGVAADTIARQHPGAFIFCAGDDYTDEDMFKALPIDAHTVKVGLGSTSAKHQVNKLERILAIIDLFSQAQGSSIDKNML